MINERIDLYSEDEYTYKAAYGFVPNIRTYVHDDDQDRMNILVVPGGAYCMVVPPEAEIVAKEFYDMGLNAFVLTYTTDITTAVPLKKQPLNDISRAVRVTRKYLSGQRYTNSNKLFICGFSAGGHLCASLATHYYELEDSNPEYSEFSNRPDGAILCYPVISFCKYVESFSKLTLLGPNPSEEEVDFFSLEKAVNEKTVPCFLWHTVTDGLVPVENSYMFAEALKKYNIPYAQHIFSHGDHGLSCASRNFFEGIFGEEYTFEQLNNAVAAVKNGTAVDITPQRCEELKIQFKDPTTQDASENPEGTDGTAQDSDNSQEQIRPQVDPEDFADVRCWLNLAYCWMKQV